MELEPKTYYHVIKVKHTPNGDVVEHLYWDNMLFEQVTKWSWYFNYRAALLQVKYPKSIVYHNWGNMPANPRKEKTILQNRAIAKKRKITEYNNKLKKAISEWNQLFPIEDDNVFKQCTQKIDKLKKELGNLNTKIQNIKE